MKIKPDCISRVPDMLGYFLNVNFLLIGIVVCWRQVITAHERQMFASFLNSVFSIIKLVP